MKNMLFSFGGFIIAALLLKESSCQNTSESSAIPLTVGNEWIYLDSFVENSKVSSVKFDTLRIEGTSEYEGNKTFLFSDGREMMMERDTLFQLVSQRSGYKFPTTVFYPSEKAATFNYAFGGDVVTQRTVSASALCPKNDWKISKCYHVSDGCRGEMIVGVGVGVIRETMTDCRSPRENYSSRTLVKINFKK